MNGILSGKGVQMTKVDSECGNRGYEWGGVAIKRSGRTKKRKPAASSIDSSEDDHEEFPACTHP